MAMANVLKLPELGENIQQGTVVSIKVAPADRMTAGQIIMEVETDKVVVEIPAEQGGQVTKLLVSVGQEIMPGAALLEYRRDTDDRVLSRQDTEASLPALQVEATPSPAKQEPATVLHLPTAEIAGTASGTDDIIAAGPSARRLARELGVEIALVKGSGPRGRIGKDDVKNFARQRLRPAAVNNGGATAEPGFGTAYDDERFGPVHRAPMTKIQRVSARNMNDSWRSIPHAWLVEKIDITQLETCRRQQKSAFAATGVSLSLTPFLVKAVAYALGEHPIFNARLDTSRDEIIYLDYVDIGVAVDTERGLLVPCLRRVNSKSIAQIAADLADVAQRGQQGRLQLADLQGAGITVSNLGNFGLSAIYPLINWPQVAIVGFAAYQREQRLFNETWQERLLLPLTLAFDHRIINGADGARFIQHIRTTLEQPFRFCLY